LESALIHFPGTILFVSHDRYFMNKIADKIFELTNNGLTIYLGDYDYYVEKKYEEQEIEKLEQAESPGQEERPKVQLSFHEQKKLQSEQRRKEREIEKIENEIEALELKLEEVEVEMTNPVYLNDHETLLDLSKQADEIREKTDQLM